MTTSTDTTGVSSADRTSSNGAGSATSSTPAPSAECPSTSGASTVENDFSPASSLALPVLTERAGVAAIADSSRASSPRSGLSLRVWRAYRIHAAHSVGSFPEGHKCRKLHGHTYRVEIEVEGPLNMATGVIVDFANIDAAWREIGEPLDHSNLNEAIGNNATSEHLAIYLLAQLTQKLPWIKSVRVLETESGGAIAEYR